MICKKLSEAMGGEISFKSEYGRGTEFTFTIIDKEDSFAAPEGNSVVKLGHLREISTAKTNSPQDEKPSSKFKGRALVVDDEYFCGYILQKTLKSLEFDADLTLSGQEAITKIKACLESHDDSMYKIIFTDINMPDMNGFEFAKNVNDILLNEKEKACPIIGITGDSSEELNNQAKLNGITILVKKPFGRNEVVNCLAENIK